MVESVNSVPVLPAAANLTQKHADRAVRFFCMVTVGGTLADPFCPRKNKSKLSDFSENNRSRNAILITGTFGSD